jgi:Outer membrane protein beta-barrel domain
LDKFPAEIKQKTIKPTPPMKRLFLLLTLFSSFAMQAQKSKSSKEPQQIFIGVNFSPDYTNRKLKNNNGIATTGIVLNSRNDNETGKFGYTTGLNVCIHFTKLIGFETGIQYSNKGYQTKKMDLNFGQPGPGLPTKSKHIYNYHYIDIPLKVNFTFGKGKVQFFSSAGFITNIFIKATQTNILEYADGRKDKRKESSTFDYKKIDISPMISVGFTYKINEKMHFTVEPTFRYGILKIIDAPITEYLWNAGLNMGFYYRLKSHR